MELYLSNLPKTSLPIGAICEDILMSMSADFTYSFHHIVNVKLEINVNHTMRKQREKLKARRITLKTEENTQD